MNRRSKAGPEPKELRTHLSSVALSPFEVLSKSLAQVPGLRILFGVVAVLAILAIARVWSLDRGWTIIGAFAVIFFGFLLTILAKMSGSARSPYSHQATVIMWFVVALFMIWCSLLTGCVFFKWPVSVQMLPLSPVEDLAEGIRQQKSIVLKQMSKVEARLQGLDGIARTLEEQGREILEWKWDDLERYPLDRGPWLSEILLITLTETYSDMIPAPEYKQLCKAQRELAAAHNRFSVSGRDPRLGRPLTEDDIAKSFLKRRDAAREKIDGALVEWTILSTAIKQYCVLVRRTCNGEPYETQAIEAFTEIEIEFMRRKLHEESPPKLLEYIRIANEEFRTLMSSVSQAGAKGEEVLRESAPMQY